jgi:hypothetical protein
MLRLTLIQDHGLTTTQQLLGSFKETIMSEIRRLRGRDVSDINSSRQLLISRTVTSRAELPALEPHFHQKSHIPFPILLTLRERGQLLGSGLSRRVNRPGHMSRISSISSSKVTQGRNRLSEISWILGENSMDGRLCTHKTPGHG